jgi:hypothetical protein
MILEAGAEMVWQGDRDAEPVEARIHAASEHL